MFKSTASLGSVSNIAEASDFKAAKACVFSSKNCICVKSFASTSMLFVGSKLDALGSLSNCMI